MRFILSFFYKFYMWVSKNFIIGYLRVRSLLDRIKNPRKKKVVVEASYNGGPIMLMALYEKGVIRNDTQALLHAAKSLGVYVIGVNTKRLDWQDSYAALLDCYIERDNFGRDFGSYKLGFDHVYSKGWDKECPRLLMINDSVFFSSKHCRSFLESLFNSSVEVLGATENHEIEHHLGSFCIAISGKVLRSEKLKSYWRDYKNSDIRPEVIERGEMGLSKCLKSVVGRDGGFRAFYDVAFVAQYIDEHPDIVVKLDRLSRKSKLTGWPVFSWEDALESNFYLKNSLVKELGDEYYFDVEDWGDIEGLIPKNQEYINKERFIGELKEKAIAYFLYCFNSGSQLHANNIFLHYIGVPIIKLDGLYRGMFNVEDIENLASQLELSQKEEFRRLMYSRPFGQDVLFGWKRLAFMLGYI